MTAKPAKSSHREQTRIALINAAEALFAQSGIDGVSLRQINMAAGQKNSSAAHYHFGSKESLIIAIFEKRMTEVNQRRLNFLDSIESTGEQTNVRRLVEALIHPIVAEINADKSGRHYIRFMAYAIGHPQLNLNKIWTQESANSYARLLKLLRAALPDIPDPIFGQRFALSFEQIVHSLADREHLRNIAGTNLKVNAALFVSNLVDCVAGAMSTPISPATQSELEQL
jgi:AcrR family transcriptional regulator